MPEEISSCNKSFHNQIATDIELMAQRVRTSSTWGMTPASDVDVALAAIATQDAIIAELTRILNERDAEINLITEQNLMMQRCIQEQQRLIMAPSLERDEEIGVSTNSNKGRISVVEDENARLIEENERLINETKKRETLLNMYEKRFLAKDVDVPKRTFDALLSTISKLPLFVVH